MSIERISAQAEEVIISYMELPLGGKKVTTPYYMNLKKERAGLRVMIGKGTDEEIVHETKVWAQLKGIDLGALDKNQIREFMVKKGIGIDCSGLITYILDAELASRGKSRLKSILKYPNNGFFVKFRRWLRPVENIGANNLTSEGNCIKIEDLNDIEPGDLIRAKGKQKNSHHVAIITEVEKREKMKKNDTNHQVVKFKYVHAHRYYEKENGVRVGVVEITDLKKQLKDQKWMDHHKDRNYMLEDLLLDYEDNGIRRLKVLT